MGRAQPIRDGTIPRLVVLRSVRMQAEPSHREQDSKQHLSMASVSAPASRFQINTFHPKLF